MATVEHTLGTHTKQGLSVTEVRAVGDDPPNPETGWTLYAQDDGFGKTQIMVIFPTGAGIQLAVEV